MTKTTGRGIGDNNPPTWAQQLGDRYKESVDAAKKWLNKAKKADLQPKTLDDCAKLEALFAEARDLANDMDRKREEEKEPHLKTCKEIDGFFNGTFRDALGTDTKKPGLARELLQAAADRRVAITREEQQRAAAQAAELQKKADELAEKQQAQEAKGQIKQADVTGVQVEALDRQAGVLAGQAAAPVDQASRTSIGGGRTASAAVKLECTGIVRADLDLEALRAYFDHDALVKAVNNGLKMKAFEKVTGAVIVEKAVGRVR
jgi:hypothetical protein